MSERLARWQGRLLGAAAVLLLAAAAFLAGMLTERVRFDGRRDEMLRRWDEQLRQHQRQLMDAERPRG